MALKGRKPEIVIPSKPKIMISGEAGTWKSTFGLNAPCPFYMDTESGANREQYMEKLIASKGLYFGVEEGSQDFNEIIGQVRELGTTTHPYKSIVIDSLTKPFNMEMYAAEDRGISSEFKKSRKEAERSTRKLIHWLTRPDLDLTVIIICHGKDKWKKEGDKLINVGTTWDGPEKLDFELDLWIETKLIGNKSYGIVKKSRVKSFPLGMQVELDFETFKKMYGDAVVDAPVKPIVLATSKQVEDINRLVEVLHIDEADLDKWLAKAQATEPEDLSAENADKLLNFLELKIKGEPK